MAVVTKTIKTEEKFAENTSNIARGYGSTYSGFHSRIDEVIHDKEVADKIYSILKEVRPKKRIKLSQEELAEYYGGENQSKEGIISEIKPREYGVFK